MILAAGILTACSDRTDAPPTAPRVGPADVSDVASTTKADNNAKPAPGPAYKVQEVVSGYYNLTSGFFGTAVAVCPAGTTLVSGGWDFYDYVQGSNLPAVTRSRANGNQWEVTARNSLPGGTMFKFVAVAYCLS
jgi:hypothetical protein